VRKVSTGFSAYLEPRPQRIAFLLNPDTATRRMLDALVDFNVDTWGGRHNPFVPLRRGIIYEDYWQLLELADPDLIYSYSPLARETLERLDRMFAPVDVLLHRPFEPDDYRPHLREQAPTSGILKLFREMFPAGFARREAAILGYSEKQAERVSSFIRRNFGVSSHAWFCARDYDLPVKLPNGPSDRDVLQLLSSDTRLSVPIQVCATQATLRAHAAHSSGDKPFVVTYGNSPWNVVHYWNNAYYSGIQELWSSGLEQMWIPAGYLSNERRRSALLDVIKRRVYPHGTNPRSLEVVSYDSSVEEASAVSDIIRQGSNLLRRGPIRIATIGSLPDISVQQPFFYRSSQPQQEYISGPESLLTPRAPRVLAGEAHARWMVDIRLDDPEQESIFSNVRYWWKLPRGGTLARRFVERHRARVNRSGELSFEVVNGSSIPLSIPSKQEVFQELFAQRPNVHLTADLRTSRASGHTIRLSDKGKYYTGVLSVFGSLGYACGTFEDQFRRSLLESMCAPTPEYMLAKTAGRLGQLFHTLITFPGQKRKEAIDAIAQLILTTARGIPRRRPPMRLNEVQKNLRLFISRLPPDEQSYWRRRVSLSSDIDDLIKREVLFQGAELRCRNCLSRSWYHVDDLAQQVTCPGCRQVFHLSIESKWSYRLNELVATAISDHGVVPVMRTLGRVARDPRESFFFIPGIDAFKLGRKNKLPRCEIDLCWVGDGEVGLAEIKSRTSAFTAAELGKLAQFTRHTHVKRVVLAAPAGDDAEMEKHRLSLERRVDDKSVIVEGWGPSAFRE
jgi:hypothetical protein